VPARRAHHPDRPNLRLRFQTGLEHRPAQLWVPAPARALAQVEGNLDRIFAPRPAPSASVHWDFNPGHSLDYVRLVSWTRVESPKNWGDLCPYESDQPVFKWSADLSRFGGHGRPLHFWRTHGRVGDRLREPLPAAGIVFQPRLLPTRSDIPAAYAGCNSG